MIWDLLILISAIPVGFLLAWLAKDELKDGKRYFKILLLISIFLALISIFLKVNYITLTLVYIAVVTFISYKKA